MPGNVRVPEIRVGEGSLSLYLTVLVVPFRLHELIQPTLGIRFFRHPPSIEIRVWLMSGESLRGLLDELYSTQIFRLQALHELFLLLHRFYSQFAHGSRGIVLPRVGLDKVGLVQREQGICHENYL